jgi:hypothetical protein
MRLSHGRTPLNTNRIPLLTTSLPFAGLCGTLDRPPASSVRKIFELLVFLLAMRFSFACSLKVAPSCAIALTTFEAVRHVLRSAMGDGIDG